MKRSFILQCSYLMDDERTMHEKYILMHKHLVELNE